MYLWRNWWRAASLLPAFAVKAPFTNTNPSQFSGRWMITSSNRLQTELQGNIVVEIENPGTFRAIGYQEKKLFASQTSRHGSFRILEEDEDEKSLLGELKFCTDEHKTTSLAGVGLPEFIPLTKSEDLGNKTRKIRLYDMHMDKIVIRFLDTGSFYTLERRLDTPAKTRDNILPEILATQLVTVTTSILFELIRQEIMKVLHH